MTEDTARTTTPPARTPAVEQTLVTAGGRRLAVRRLARDGGPRAPDGGPGAPDGGPEPVVLVHGLGQSSTDWLRLMPELDGALDPWAVDLPGHGQSPPPADGDYSPGAHARAVVDLVEHQVGGPVHLVGNSLGGLVSLVVATRRPDLVRSLTLVAPALPARVPTRGALQLMLLATPRLGEHLVRAGAARPVDRRARDLLSVIFAEPDAVSADDLAALVDEITEHGRLPHAGPAFMASLRGLVQVHLMHSRRAWAMAGRVRVPTLVLYGGRDKLVTVRSARRARQMFPDAHVEVDPTAGHVPQREHPQEFARTLLRHVRTAASAGS